MFAYIRSSYKFSFFKSYADMEGKAEAVEVSPLLQEKHQPAEMKETETEIAKKTSGEEVNAGDKLKDSVKKPKEASKQNPCKATNHTIPRPFLLATEKRMSRERRASVDFSFNEEKRSLTRERRGSLDFNEMQQRKLSKSVSLNKAQLSSTSAGSIAKRSAAPKVSSNKLSDKSNGMIKGEDRKHTLVKPIKKNVTEGASTGALGKSSTFKALPLPSFYHKNDSATSKLTTKREPKMTASKSPSLSQPSKANKTVEDKQKKVSASRAIGNRAKETINRMLRSTQKALNPSKETAKMIAATA
ncbi:hypothetical protein CDL15_Pgr003683 [Punica granatum]|nr:hypothetical protein CDL15_Pgr003683 [Punica granatum]